VTLRCEILTLKTSDSFFRSFCFLRQNEALSATEQNQTYKNSLFLETSMQFSNRIKCDVGANKNAGQAFLFAPTSHFILYQVSGFRLFSPSNHEIPVSSSQMCKIVYTPVYEVLLSPSQYTHQDVLFYGCHFRS
jgi:hypothetical protein